MAVSQTAEYALRAVVWLAQNPDAPQPTADITQATKVPASYLPKVLHPLVREGIVIGQRGLHGGYILARDPAELTVLDVVGVVDPIRRIDSCPLKLASHDVKLCPLHKALDNVISMIHDEFAAITIQALLKGRGRPRPLCETTKLTRGQS